MLAICYGQASSGELSEDLMTSVFARRRSSFPELAAHPPVVRANGKTDLEIKTAELGFRHTASEARAEFLVFPGRNFTGPSGFRTVERSRAAEWMYEVLCVGDQEVRNAQKQSLDALLQLPILELCYRDPIDGEAHLTRLVTHGI